MLKAIRDFFSIAASDEYRQRVPANGTSNHCFEFSPAVTKYINEQFSKAYRKPTTLINYTNYNYLFTNNLFAPESKRLPDGWQSDLLTDTGRERKKIIPIYTIELRSKTKMRMEGLEADEEKKPGGSSKYTYTCIFKQPKGAKGILLSKKRKSLAANGNTAEIGIASFMDTIREIRERGKLTKMGSHRVPIKTGKIGRPIKRRKSSKD